MVLEWWEYYEMNHLKDDVKKLKRDVERLKEEIEKLKDIKKKGS